jgi:cyclohexadienyl dehydratase
MLSRSFTSSALAPVMRTCRASIVALLACALFASSALSADSRDVLRVGTSGDYPPFSFSDDTGSLRGFDIAVARRLTEDLGLPVDFVMFRWPDLLTHLQRQAFDIAMSGVTVRPDRALHARFTRPYAVTGAVAVIRRQDHAKLRTLDDLDSAQARILVNAGGHLERAARQRFAKARISTVADNLRLPAALADGSADAVISEVYEARTWKGDFVVLGPFTRDRKAYALPRTAARLHGRVNDWLAAREADGWLNGLRRQWFGDAAVVSAAAACFEAIATAIDLRLQQMPAVAVAKRAKGLAIEDVQQEKHVLEAVRQAAVAAGLGADDVVEVFRLLIDAAKSVQRTALGLPAKPESSAQRSGEPAKLEDLRLAIADASDALISELSRCQTFLRSPSAAAQLEAILRHGLTVSGLPPNLLPRLAGSLERVRKIREVTPSASRD